MKVNRGAQFFVRNGEPARTDVFPPSRVTDVAVASYVNQTLYAVLEWSAPGGDRDKGAADRYVINGRLAGFDDTEVITLLNSI